MNARTSNAFKNILMTAGMLLCVSSFSPAFSAIYATYECTVSRAITLPAIPGATDLKLAVTLVGAGGNGGNRYYSAASYYAHGGGGGSGYISSTSLVPTASTYYVVIGSSSAVSAAAGGATQLREGSYTGTVWAAASGGNGGSSGSSTSGGSGGSGYGGGGGGGAYRSSGTISGGAGGAGYAGVGGVAAGPYTGYVGGSGGGGYLGSGVWATGGTPSGNEGFGGFGGGNGGTPASSVPAYGGYGPYVNGAYRGNGGAGAVTAAYSVANNKSANGYALITYEYTPDTTAPSVPGTPYYSKPFSSGTIEFNWLPSTDDGAGIGKYIYEIYHDGFSSSDLVVTGSTTATSFTFTGGIGGFTYYCRVRAQDKAYPANNVSAWSDFSNGLLVKPPAAVENQLALLNIRPAGSVARYDIAGFYYNGTSAVQGEGYESRVNDTVAGNQNNPGLTSLTNGKFVAVWASGGNIYGKLIEPTGLAGSEFQLNAYDANTGYCSYPRVAGLTDGGFAVVWEVNPSGKRDIYIRRFDASGAPLSTQVRVGASIAYDKQQPDIVSLTNGYFLVVWDQDRSSGLHMIRRATYSVSGSLSTPIESNGEVAAGSLSYRYPRVASYGGGTDYVVVYCTEYDTHWPVNPPHPSEGDIYMRPYNGVNTPYSDEVRVNTTVSLKQFNPVVTGYASGFAISWAGEQAAAEGSSTYGFYHIGQASWLRIDSYSAWSNVYLQRYGTDRVALGAETVVEQGSILNSYIDPAIKSVEAVDAMFGVFYRYMNDSSRQHYYSTDDGVSYTAPLPGLSSDGLYSRFYNFAGNQLTSERLPINTHAAGAQDSIAVASSLGGEVSANQGYMMAAWQSKGQDYSTGYGIFAKNFVIGPRVMNLTHPQAYASIQSALDAASANDVIALIDGVFEMAVPLQIKKNVTLRAYLERGVSKERAIISGQYLSRIMDIAKGVSVSIENVTIFQGAAEGANSFGAAVSCNGKSELFFRNVLFKDNYAAQGGAVFNFRGASRTAAPLVLIENCEFSGNFAAGTGGGVMYAEYATVTINNCTFTGNQSASTATLAGGGVFYSNGARIVISDSIFYSNTALNRGGVYRGAVENTSELITERCTFARNNAPNGGDVISLFNTMFEGRNSVFHHNTARTTRTYVIDCNQGSLARLLNCSFVANNGVIKTDSGNGTVEAFNSLFRDNGANSTLFYGTGLNKIFKYCYVEGGTSFYSENTITAEPYIAFSSLPFLTEGSSCFDAGQDLSPTIAVDIENVVRPQGTSHDIGAYEGKRPFVYDLYPGNSFAAPQDLQIQFITWLVTCDVSNPLTVTIDDLRGNPGTKDATITFTAISTLFTDSTGHFQGLIIPAGADHKRVVIWATDSSFLERGDHFRVQVRSYHVPPEGDLYRTDIPERFTNQVQMEFFVAGIPFLSEWYEGGLTQNNTVLYGSSVGNGADIDQDGYPDLIVGDPGYDNKLGQAFLYYGGPEQDREVKAVFLGATPNAEFGAKVALVYVNGDDYGDVLIGAPGENKVYLYYGSPALPGSSAIDIEHPSFVLSAPAGCEYRFGEVVEHGDVNGDGYQDILVAVPSYNGSLGAVVVYSGASLKTGSTEVYKMLVANGEGFARSLMSADLDRDGVDDIVVGLPDAAVSGKEQAGKAYIYFGNNSVPDFFSTLQNPAGDAVLQAPVPQEHDHFAYSLAKGKDINHDNFQDILIGKYTDPGKEGCAWIVYGGVRGDIGSTVRMQTIVQPRDIEATESASANSSVQQFGLTLASAGDLDGDSYDDFIIAAPYAGSSGMGMIFVYLGGELIDETFDGYEFNGYVLSGHDANANLGRSLLNIQDFNSDGYDEIAFNDRSMGENCVRVYYNADATDIAAPMITYAMPHGGMVGVPEYATYNFTIYDRGKSGLNLATLSLRMYPRGLGDAEGSLKTKIIQLIAPAGILNANNGMTQFSGYVRNMAMIVHKEDGTTVSLTSIPVSDYNAAPGLVKAVEIRFNLDPKVLMESSEGYEFEFTAQDWGAVPPAYQDSYFSGLALTPNIISFSTNQKLFVTGNQGTKVRSIGDYNGDGLDDVAVFTPGAMVGGADGLYNRHQQWFTGSWQNNYQGYVLVYFGGPDIKFDTPNVILVGGDTTQTFATDVFGVPQISRKHAESNDVYHDTVVLEGKNASGVSRVHVFIGQPLAKGNTPIVVNSSDAFPVSSNYYVDQGIPLYDINGDDYPDMALSDSGTSNMVVVLYGCGTKVDSKMSVLLGPAGSRFGAALAEAGRALVIGAPNASYGDYVSRGAVCVVPNRTDSTILASRAIGISEMWVGAREGAHFGASVASGYVNDGFVTPNTVPAGAYADIVVGAPNDGQFARNAGSVSVFFGKSTGFAPLPTSTPDVVLLPESKDSEFGTQVAISKYLSTPGHYKRWSPGADLYNKDYYDDYDDIVISARTYSDEMSIGVTGNGKIYVFTGGRELSGKASAGYMGSPREKLGLIINGGDVLGMNSDSLFVMSSADDASQFYLLQNRDIPDTVHPIFVQVSPANDSYDVSLNAAIVFEVADASGISKENVNVFRYRKDYTDTDRWIVQGGVVADKSQDNPIKEYDLVSADIGTSGTTVRFTLRPNSNYRPLPDEYAAGQWTESEPVNLELYVGDARVVWISDSKRELQPLVSQMNYGFMTQFKSNEATEIELLGQALPNTYFGSALASVGDVNGDRYVDFMIGEYGNNEDGVNSGKAYLFLGSGDFYDLAHADLTLGLGTGTAASRFGYKVAPAGDMNNDGYDDVAITALNSGSSGGEVFVLFGGPGVITGVNSSVWNVEYLNRYATVVQAASPQDGFGTAIYGDGDINGDGYDDLLIGAPFVDVGSNDEAGRVYVILGHKYDTSFESMSARNQAPNPNSIGGSVGPIQASALKALSAVDLSSFDPTATSGTLKGFYLDGHEAYERFGYTVISGVNINGDTAVVPVNNAANANATKNTDVSELIVGAPGAARAAGKVYIYSFDTDTKVLSQVKVLSGEAEGDQFGASLAGMGDMTNDGNLLGIEYDDFAVGAPYNNTNGTDAGAAYLFTGKADITQVTGSILTFFGQNAGDRFGYAMANVGNVDNDEYGINDLAIAAPFNARGGANAGRVYIFGAALSSETPHTLVMDKMADFADEGDDGYLFGFALSGLGDLDGDFVPEYMIGAPAYASNNIDNRGRVFMYTNPDNFGPTLNLGWLTPLPGSTDNEKVHSYFDENLGVTINEPLKIRLYAKDNRIVYISGTSVQLRGEDENRGYTYWFNPSVPSVNYYTVHNRKIVEFFVVHPYYRYGERVDVTVNIIDTRGNKLGANLALTPNYLGEPYTFHFFVEENPFGGPSKMIAKVNPALQTNGAGGIGDSKLYTKNDMISVALAARDKDGGVRRVNFGMGSTDILGVAGNIPVGAVAGLAGAVSADPYDDDGTTAITFNINVYANNFNSYYSDSSYGSVQLSAGEGVKTFAFQAWDVSNNPSEVVTVSIILDTLPPTISARYPAPGSTGIADQVSVSFTANDDGTGINLENLSVVVERGSDRYQYFVPYGTQTAVFSPFTEVCSTNASLQGYFGVAGNGSCTVADGVADLAAGTVLRSGSSAYNDGVVALKLSGFSYSADALDLAFRSSITQTGTLQYGYVLSLSQSGSQPYCALTLKRVMPSGAYDILASGNLSTLESAQTAPVIQVIMNGSYLKVFWNGECKLSVTDPTYLAGTVGLFVPSGKHCALDEIGITRFPAITITADDDAAVQLVHQNAFENDFAEFTYVNGVNAALVDDITDVVEPINQSLQLNGSPVSISFFTDALTLSGLGSDHVINFNYLTHRTDVVGTVFFRVQDPRNGYVLTLEGGSVRWGKMVNGTLYDDDSGWCVTSDINIASRTNVADEWSTYTLKVNGTRFSLLQNGTLLSSVIDIDPVYPSFTSGGFGFAAIGAANTVLIDDLSVGNLLKNNVHASLDLPKFDYEDMVTISITVEDQTALDYETHRVLDVFSYKVSPDYRAPQNPVVVINDGDEFCTLLVKVSANAVDDTGIVDIFISGDVTNDAQGVTVNAWIPIAGIGTEDEIPVYLDSYRSDGFYSETPIDGKRVVSVRLRDAQGNVSAVATDDIMLAYFTTEGHPVVSKFFINGSTRATSMKFTSSNSVALYVDGFDVEGVTKNVQGEIAAYKIMGNIVANVYVTPNQWYPFPSTRKIPAVSLASGEGTRNISIRLLDRDFIPVTATATDIAAILLSINSNPGVVTEGVLGRMSAVATASIVYDMSGPQFTLCASQPLNGYQSSYYCRAAGNLQGAWRAVDVYSGISRYDYCVYEVSVNTTINTTTYATETWKSYDLKQDWRTVPQTHIIDDMARVTAGFTLSADKEGYCFVVKAVDGAGNYTVATTNLLGIDTTKPNEPSYNYEENAVLRRPVFDIDFVDDLSGVYQVAVALNNQGQTKQPITNINNEIPSSNGGYYRICSRNWTMDEYIWAQIAEGTNTLYFKITDAAGNISYPSTALNKYTFVKDTIPPTGTVRFDSGAKFTKEMATTVSVDFAAESKGVLVYLTRYPVSENIFLSDYSFEDSGAYDLVPSWSMVRAGLTTDQVTMSVKQFSTAAADSKKVYCSAKDGLYGLVVSFNVPNEETDHLANWALQRSIYIATANVTYNVHGFINLSDVAGCLDYSRNWFTVVARYVSSNGVAVEVANPARLWNGEAGDGSGWNEFSFDIYVPNSTELTIQVKTGRSGTDAFDLVGYIVLDDVNLIPGGDLVATENQKISFRYPLEPGDDGYRKLYVTARDKAGNWTSSEKAIYYDTTAPSFNAPNCGVWIFPVSGNGTGYQKVNNKLMCGFLADDGLGSGLSYYAYAIDRCTPVSDDPTWTQIKTVSGKTAVLTVDEVAAFRNVAYRYRVKAVDALGNSGNYVTSDAVYIDVDEPQSFVTVSASLPDGLNPQGSGWYKDGPILVTISAIDCSRVSDAIYDMPTVNGSGVSTINYVTGYVRDGVSYFEPTVSVTILSPTQQVVVALDKAGQNLFGYWASDAVGWVEKVNWVNSENLHIDKDAPTVTTNLHIYSFPNAQRWFNARKLPIEYTMDDQMRAHVVNNMLRHRDDRLGDGTYKLYYKVDDNPTGSMVLDSRVFGSGSPWPVAPTLSSAIAGWDAAANAGLSPYIEPFTVRSADGTLAPIEGEGIHIVYYWAEDKYEHFSTVNYVDDIRVDNGKPMLSLDMGGSFQTMWCTDPSGIRAHIEVRDFYDQWVSYNASWYRGLRPTGFEEGVKYQRPGSGIKSFWYQLNSETPVERVFSTEDAYIGDYQEDRFSWETNVMIKTNGYNMLQYIITDNAYNVADIFKSQLEWHADLHSWLAAADTGMIRYIRLDNEPPTAAAIMLNRYKAVPLYTNNRLVSCNLLAQETGIGVKYAHISGYDITDPATYNALEATTNILFESFMVPASQLFTVNAWAVIAAQDADYYWDFQNNRSPRAIIDMHKYVWLHDQDGTKNIEVAYGDDFSFPYEAVSANEELSYAQYQAWRDNVSADAQYPVFLPSEKARLDAIDFANWPTRAVFIDIRPAIDNHMSATASTIIVLDRHIAQGSITSDTVLQTKIGPFVTTKNVLLTLYQADMLDLSGIDAVKVYGDLENNGNNNVWLPATSGVTQNVLVRIPTTQYDSVTINIYAVWRDRADNISSPVTLSFQYETPMEADNPQYRINFPNGNWYMTTRNVPVVLNFPGANLVHFIGDVESATGTQNYRPSVACTLTDGDGLKSVGIWLEDRLVSTTTLTQNFLLDRYAPVGTDNVNNAIIYEDQNGANFVLSFSDNPTGGIQVAGIKKVHYQVNTDAVKTIELRDAAGYYAPETYTVTVNIRNKSTNNQLRYWSEDMAGNVSAVIVRGAIKVNTLPVAAPQLRPVTENRYSDVLAGADVYYVNTRTVTLNLSAVNASRVWLYGDIDDTVHGPYGITVGGITPRAVTLIGAENVVQKVHVVYGDDFSMIGGKTVGITINVILDTVAPDKPSLVSLSAQVSADPTIYCTSITPLRFRVHGNGSDVGSQSIMIKKNGVEAVRTSEDSTLVSRLAVDFTRPGDQSVFSVVARDRAGNESEAVTFNAVFNPNGGVRLVSGDLPDDVDVEVVVIDPEDVRMQQANQKVKGVIASESLERTVRDFSASGDVFTGTEIEMVIPFPTDLGSINPYDLRIYTYDPLTAKWVQVQGEHVVDMEAHVVRVRVTHFSIYRIFATRPFANNLSNVRVYPNPFKPDSGDRGAGGGDDTQYITIDNITPTSKVRIYTISGELVSVIEAETGVSQLEWDATNTEGEKVASGVYIYLVTDKDGHKKMGRMTIIRGEIE